ncbi:lactonase family protein [Sporolactobacillus sp. CQH2019]|nr:lactonase family protein [Sporolactobacillus sp. CQH2019]MDD9150102.1 lactonase family protein [Sporolactobacillus sp. CQH2019]
MKMSIYRGFAGTYTNGDSEGIYSFILDTDRQMLDRTELAARLDNPTYLTFSEDDRRLYSVIKKDGSGGVAAFAVTPEGRLRILDEQISKGAPPCYVGADRENHHLLSANYHKGTVAVYPIGENRGAGPASDVVHHQGSGADRSRQEGPHVHFADYTPDGRFVVAIDLGTDTLTTYQEAKGKLIRQDVLAFKPGTGPRHLAFHPKAPFAYVMSEISSEVIVLRFDAASGHFSVLQTIRALPAAFRGHNQGSAIRIPADGRFVYVSNRGDNSIVLFGADKESGTLTLLDRVSTGGEWPRDFALDPSERFLIAANQNTGSLVLFTRDPETGRLAATGSKLAVPDPVCVKFLHAPR